MTTVRKDTQSIDNSGSGSASAEQNYEQNYSQEGQQQSAPAETQPPAGGENPPAASTESAPGEAGGSELSDPKKFAEALLQQLGQVQQGQASQGQEQAPEPSFDEQMGQKRESVVTSLKDTLGTVQKGMADLHSKMETGDIDLQTYMVQREALNEQKWEAQRGADAELMKIDNEVSRVREREEERTQSARMQYAEQNPDFTEMYNSGQLQQVMQDPAVSSVFGNNPAAAHQFIRGQQLQSENQSLREKIAELEKAQQSAISGAAQNPNGKIGTSSGGNSPTQAPTQNNTDNPTDSMLAAMMKARGGV